MTLPTDIPQRRQSDLPGAGDPVLEALEQYWQSLRRAQTIPNRNDIEPRALDAALPHTFILQRVAPGIARMRVAGQQLHELLKMDARGMPLSAFFLPEARDRLAAHLEEAFAQPAIMCLPLHSPGSLIRPAMTANMLLLPLRDRDGETSRLLGGIVTSGQPSSRPRRFAFAEGRAIRHEPIGIRLASARSILRRDPERAETARPALRLVVSNS